MEENGHSVGFLVLLTPIATLGWTASGMEKNWVKMDVFLKKHPKEQLFNDLLSSGCCPKWACLAHHCGKFCLISFQICTREVWKNQNYLSKVCELPCLILIKHTGMHKTGICQVINSTRGRFQSNMAEKLTKLTIFPLAVCPQGGQGCKKREKNPQNSNFWLLGATMKF